MHARSDTQLYFSDCLGKGHYWGSAMRTTVLAYLMALMGLVVIAVGAWGLFISVAGREPVALTHYAIAIAMISGGLGMGGLAQALRLLLAINRALSRLR
jgi:hypothetical protein